MSEFPSTSSGSYDDDPNSKYDITLSALENATYFENCALSVEDVQTKLQEFSNLFNSLCRLTLLNCTTNQTEELIYLLLTLKKNIKWAILEMNKTLSKKDYNFTCGMCGANIYIEPGRNMWDTLQDHEHFEKMYYDFLNNKLDLETLPGPSKDPQPNYNTDSGIEHVENDHSTNEEEDMSPKREPQRENMEEDVNSFRFNFVLHYDDIIESKIYPQNILNAVRKIDGITDYTMQRAGPARAICLLCPCEMTRLKASRYVLLSHATGQRHLRFASNPVNVSALMAYHETWLKQELPIQAHQVYFRPELKPNVKCCLCSEYIDYNSVIPHIMDESHKTKVLNMYEKRINSYFLISLQVQVYGITQDSKDTHGGSRKHKQSENIGENNDSDSSEESKKPLSHNIIKAVDNTDNNIFSNLPNRYKPHLEVLKKLPDNSIFCEYCKVTLPKNNIHVEDIRAHILQSTHQKYSHNSLRKYHYYCEICNIKIPDELAWISHHDIGPNKHSSMAESRKSQVAEYECTTCRTVIFGDELSLNRHRSVGAVARKKKDKTIKLPDTIKQLFKSKAAINTEGQKLTEEAEEVLKTTVTMDCCKELEKVLSQTFETCKVYPFGSRISGLGNLDSDLDVFVDTGDMYFGNLSQDSGSQIQLVKKTTKALIKLKLKFQSVVQIPTARTPIVKFYHSPTDLECDLSFKNGLSVENTKFLRFCLLLQPITQPFVLLLKWWADHSWLDQIPMYAVAILGIFYMQCNGYLLSVKKIRELNQKKSMVISGWETINYVIPLEEMKLHVKLYENDLTKLLADFFDYFATKFDFGTDVVCPLLGQLVKKTQFDDIKSLPAEMKPYKDQYENLITEGEVFRSNTPFCVQDPFDLSHNLTKACQQGTVAKFKELSKLTTIQLQSLK